MSLSRSQLLRWQFEFTWSLFEFHLERLRAEDFLWEPTSHCWTMHPAPDDGWFPDFEETEPDPVPVPTIAWGSWHVGWWWTVTIDHCLGREPRDRTEIEWPGPGEPTIAWLRGLRDEWLDVLADLTDDSLDTTAPFPWHSEPEKTVAHMVSWVNAELMKNVAEIGQLRLLHVASGGASE